jgi:hypothetical protein
MLCGDHITTVSLHNSIVSKLVPHIEVAIGALRHLHVHQGLPLLPGLRWLCILPQRATVRTGNVVRIRLCPGVEALLVKVVATRGTAPRDVFILAELHAADSAVIFNRLAVAIVRPGISMTAVGRAGAFAVMS